MSPCSATIRSVRRSPAPPITSGRCSCIGFGSQRASLSWKCRPSNVVVSCVQRLRRIRHASSSMSIRTPIRGRESRTARARARTRRRPSPARAGRRRRGRSSRPSSPPRPDACTSLPGRASRSERGWCAPPSRTAASGPRTGNPPDRCGSDRSGRSRYPVVAELLAAQPAVAIVLEARVLRPGGRRTRIASPKICTAGLRRLPGRGRAPSRRSCPAGPGGARC